MSYYSEAREYHECEKYEEAYKLYEQGANAGDEKCFYGIALFFHEGYFVEENKEKASKIFAEHFDAILKLAENGDAEAMFIIYCYYSKGFYGDKDNELGILWLNKFEATDFVRGQDHPIEFYYTIGYEFYINKDYDKAYKYFSKGEKVNNPSCIYAKGTMVYRGLGTTKNESSGKKLIKFSLEGLEKQAVSGFQKANGLLCRAYSNFDFIKNEQKQFEALLRSYSTNTAAEWILNDLAEIYQHRFDYDKAIQLYNECAEKYNSAAAFRNLGYIYISGMTSNGKMDIEKAVLYFEKSYHLGDLFANEELIKIYLGLMNDPVDSFVNYERAKMHINSLIQEDTTISGELYLSLCYALSNDFPTAKEVFNKIDFSGSGVLDTLVSWDGFFPFYKKLSVEQFYAMEQILYMSFSKKVELIERANLRYCDADCPHACMAYFYHWTLKQAEGYRGKKLVFDKNQLEDIKEKYIRYCLEGMQHNEPNSYEEYGSILFDGEYLEENKAEALKNYLIAFQLEAHDYTGIKIAEMYEDGVGTNKNRKKAISFYKKAYELGGHDSKIAGLCLMYYYSKSKDPELQRKANQIAKKYNGHELYIQIQDTNYEKYFWIENFLYKKGNKDSLMSIAICYDIGQGVKKDTQKAVQLYKKCIQTYQGNFALYAIGSIYCTGDGIKKNIPLSIKYFKDSLIDTSKEMYYYSCVELFKIYSDVSSKYYDPSAAIAYLKIGAESGDGDADNICRYMLGAVYHQGKLVKKDLKLASKYYEEAYNNGYNCSYALEMVKMDSSLEDFFVRGKKQGMNSKQARLYARNQYEKSNQDNRFQRFVKEKLLGDICAKKDKVDVIREELKKDFDEIWFCLDEESQKALITGVYIYSALVDVGYEYYQDLDFGPVINQFSKAYETQLKKCFYTGFINWLKEKKIPVSDFVQPNSQRQIAIVETYYNTKSKTKPLYRYVDPENSKGCAFSLGSVYYIITFSPQGDGIAPRDNTLSFNNRINKHLLAYAKEIFNKESFSLDNFDYELANFLMDLACDTKTIMDRRNPSAHGEFMSIDEAELCADYLIKVKKVIYNFMCKIKCEFWG